MRLIKVHWESILTLVFWSLVVSPFIAKPKNPNIIILADDLDSGDPEVHNPDSKIPIPTSNALAKSGIRFADAHSPNAEYSELVKEATKKPNLYRFQDYNNPDFKK